MGMGHATPALFVLLLAVVIAAVLFVVVCHL